MIFFPKQTLATTQLAHVFSFFSSFHFACKIKAVKKSCLVAKYWVSWSWKVKYSKEFFETILSTKASSPRFFEIYYAFKYFSKKERLTKTFVYDLTNFYKKLFFFFLKWRHCCFFYQWFRLFFEKQKPKSIGSKRTQPDLLF